jgi:hypothetical protein
MEKLADEVSAWEREMNAIRATVKAVLIMLLN